MEDIAIMIPMCSRNQTWETLQDCFFFDHFYPSFLATASDAFKYTFYLGIDDDDVFFLKHVGELEEMGFTVVTLSGCQHAPAWAWNKLFEVAIANADHEYFFQVGDDVVIQSKGWTERFVSVLQSRNGVGAVGPCNPRNFFQRKNAGQPAVIENSFVSRTHARVFGYFFHPTIRNWYCDDWITQVYGAQATTCEDMIVRNRCVDNRYAIETTDVGTRVAEGRDRLKAILQM